MLARSAVEPSSLTRQYYKRLLFGLDLFEFEFEFDISRFLII